MISDDDVTEKMNVTPASLGDLDGAPLRNELPETRE